MPPPFGDGNGEVVEPPRYSARPSADEETVAITPRVPTTLPQGTFVKEWPQARLVLMDQEDGAKMPSYGRYGQVIGELGLKSTTGMASVTAKLTGQLNISPAETGIITQDFVSDSRLLWKQGDKGDCPSILPIFFQIPMTYEAEGRQWHLPPSLEVTPPRGPTVQVVYTLSVTITKLQFWGQWTRNEELGIPLEYYPRTRPVRPVGVSGRLLEEIKTAADEWTEIVDQIDVRPKYKDSMSPIECQIFVPSMRTFAIGDAIPFHVQLTGTAVSLCELLPESSPLRMPCDDQRGATIEVGISRQIVIGRRRARAFRVGEGRLWPVPPSACPAQRGDRISVDWHGEARCGPQVRYGGFVGRHVSIEDSLVFSLGPPNTRASFLVPLQVAQGIRLVSDRWRDRHPLDV